MMRPTLDPVTTSPLRHADSRRRPLRRAAALLAAFVICAAAGPGHARPADAPAGTAAGAGPAPTAGAPTAPAAGPSGAERSGPGAAVGARSTDPAVEAARRHREANGAAILKEFADLLSMPNVASDDAGIRKNAAWIRDALGARGVRAELLESPGAPPIVFGTITTPGATRTIGIYVHYDGQPADVSTWTTPPWSPVLLTARREDGGTERPLPRPGEAIDPEWRLYARSAGDDKAPIAALLGALDALKGARVPVSSNVVLFFEGEEENGSPHLGEHLERARARLAGVDLWLFCDGPVHQSRLPQLVFGARGVVTMEVTVYGPKRPLHSGHYGNWAPVPGVRLAHLIASMKDEDGRVRIEGFYDDVAPVGPAERAAVARLPVQDETLRRELGLAHTEEGDARLEEQILKPALNVEGLASGNVGALHSNAIPSTATATFGIRMVKGNDPEKMQDLVEAHIRRQGYRIVRDEPTPEERLAHAKIARVQRGRGYPAARTAMDLPVVAPLVAAVERAAGEAPLMLPSYGGSIPLYLFVDGLKTPTVMVPIVNHDNNQHAADENIRIANLWYGVDLFAAVLTMR